MAGFFSLSDSVFLPWRKQPLGLGSSHRALPRKKQLSILRKAWESKAVPGFRDQGKDCISDPERGTVSKEQLSG